MMRLVKFPKRRNTVLEGVIDEEPKLIGEKERERAGAAEDEVGLVRASRAPTTRVKPAATKSLIHDVETTAQPMMTPSVASPMTQ